MEEIAGTRTIEVTKLALDGLMMRQKAISANTANVMTPNYQRKDVAFEDQLRNMIQKDDLKKTIKQANSAALSYNVTSLENIQRPDANQLRFLNQNVFQNFNPEVVTDMSTANPETGNNVEVEKEMMNMAKTGTQYSVLARLENKQFSNLTEIIKGNAGGPG